MLVLHRRAGKTAVAVNKLVIEAVKDENSGRTFWYIAPTYRMAKGIVWNDPNMLFKFIPPELIKKKNETELSVRLFNNSLIQLKGGDNFDSLRGQDPYGIIVDEAQDHKLEELYNYILKPVLAANNGWIWMIGTPKSKDFFFKIYVYAKGKSNWQSYTLSAEDSGIIPLVELEEIRKTTPLEVYNQEYRALFTDDGASPFRNVRRCIKNSMEPPNPNHYYQIGVDLARKEDFTVITVYDICCDKIAWVERFTEINWPFQKAKIEAMARRYSTEGRPSRIVLDSTGLGDPICQDLQQAGLLVLPIQFSLKSKQQLVENAIIKFDQEAISIPNFQPLIDELETFESRKTRNGRLQYGHPEIKGMQDDCVLSLCLALWGVPNVKRHKHTTQDRKTLLMQKYKELGLNKPKNNYGYKNYERDLGF